MRHWFFGLLVAVWVVQTGCVKKSDLGSLVSSASKEGASSSGPVSFDPVSGGIKTASETPLILTAITPHGYVTLGCKQTDFNFCATVRDQNGAAIRVIGHSPKIKGSQLTDYVAAYQLAYDPGSDSVIFAGGTSVNLVEPIAGGPNTTTQPRSDIFVAKFKLDGTQAWIKQFGAVTQPGAVGDDRVTGVSVTEDGSIYLSGITLSAFVHPLEQMGDHLLIKLDASGKTQWVRQFQLPAAYGSREAVMGVQVKTDKAQNALVYGVTYVVPPAGVSYPNTFVEAPNGFICKYTPTGQQVWCLNKIGTGTSDLHEGPGGELYALSTDGISKISSAGSLVYKGQLASPIQGGVNVYGGAVALSELTTGGDASSSMAIDPAGYGYFCGSTFRNYSGNAYEFKKEYDLILFKVSLESGVIMGAKQFGAAFGARSSGSQTCGDLHFQNGYLTLFGASSRSTATQLAAPPFIPGTPAGFSSIMTTGFLVRTNVDRFDSIFD